VSNARTGVDFGNCYCDRTYKACDVRCCCDPECPFVWVNSWRNAGKCQKEAALLTRCMSQNTLVWVNQRYGIVATTDNVNEQICVSLPTPTSSLVFQNPYASLDDATTTKIKAADP
jgi:hypothetical protein